MLFKSGFFSLLGAFILFTAAGQQRVSPADSHLQYMGRLSVQPDSVEMYWSGTSVAINFQGSEIKAVLKDQKADNFFNVIIDRDSVYKLKLDPNRKEYTLASNLSPGKHRVELYKITEFDRGTTTFYGFQLSSGAKLLKPDKKKRRKIEVYGNSITCGYGVEDDKGDSPASVYENNYLTYAALTARHYHAAYSFIAKSGIGITISWFPYTMPDIYDRLNPNDASSRWNFSAFKPDIVIINLFQNDSWLTNNSAHPEFKRVFGTQKPSPEFITNAYAAFLRSIRDKHPKAKIVCVLGNMDATREGSPWPGYIKKAVEQLKDKKIYTHFFPYKNTPGHPDVAEQQAMADSLIRFIDTEVGW